MFSLFNTVDFQQEVLYFFTIVICSNTVMLERKFRRQKYDMQEKRVCSKTL